MLVRVAAAIAPSSLAMAGSRTAKPSDIRISVFGPSTTRIASSTSRSARTVTSLDCRSCSASVVASFSTS